MDSRKLEMLVTAADLGSFTRAAEAVGYTQSGLTHMMDSLEREMGFPLLARGHSGVSLTEEGEKLMPAIRDFLKADARLSDEISRIRREDHPVIRVAAYASIAMRWLPEIIYQFRRESGGADVDLRMVDNALEPFELLEAGKADVIFASKQEQREAGLDWIPLYDEPVCAILPENYPINGRHSFPVREFEQLDFIMPYGRFDLDVNRAFEASGATVRTRPAYVDDETVIRMVERGLGVTMMAELMYRGRTEHVLCMPLEPAVSRQLGMGVRSRQAAPAPVRQMIDCVLQLIPQLKAQM